MDSTLSPHEPRLDHPPIAAVFDLDDTLVAGSTGRFIVKYLRDAGLWGQYVRPAHVAKLLGATLLYRAGLIDTTRVMQLTVSAVRGIDVQELWQVVQRWFDVMVVHALAPGALERMEWHVNQGHVPIICTASSQFSALPVARHLGVPYSIYTEWQDDGTRMTGKVRLPIAHGTGKVYWLRQWADSQGASLRDAYFYTDHHSDLPLLEAVGHPAVVNPSPALRTIAQQRGWPILTWF